MKSNTVKRPIKWLYLPLVGLANIYTILVKRHRIVGKEAIDRLGKGPLLVVGNHTGFYDFLYMLRALYPNPINFVVSAKYFRFRGLSFLLRLAGAIPKNLFSADIRTVSRSISIIKQGGIVGIYPEGQISQGGVTLPLPEGIGKLVKHLGVPVVAVKTYGAGFVDPPWSDRHRRGVVESHVAVVLDRTALQEMSAEAVDRSLMEALDADSYEWQQKNGYVYHGKNLADGLTNILYLCPNCRGEFTLETGEDRIACVQCGMKAVVDGSGHLQWDNTKPYFPHIGEWFDWQLHEEETAVQADPQYKYSLSVALSMFPRKGNGLKPVGCGTVTITRERYEYRGSVGGEETSIPFAVAATPHVPFDGGHNFQLYLDNELYVFRPDSGKKSVKAALVGNAMYHLYTKK